MIQWNGRKANQDKCHFLSSHDISTKFLLPACILENPCSQKLLGVTIDKNWTFNKHVKDMHNKAIRYTPNTKTTISGCLFFVTIYLLSLDEPQ